MGAVFGVIVGLPALRLRTFYFAMTTLGFATIVTQVALAWKDVTGGGVGTPGPVVPLAVRAAAGASTISASSWRRSATWMTANIGASRYGRALVAIRDAEVAAEAVGHRQAQAADDGLPASRRPGRRGRRAVRLAAVLHHARRLHLRDVGAVLHRHPDRRPRLDPGAGARHHHPDGAARVRGAAGAVVDLPLRGAPAGDRAAGAGRHRRPARLQEPPAARAASRDRAAARSCWRACSTGRTRKHSIADLKDIALHFGGVRAIDGLDLRNPLGRGARPDRPQRQRQDHDAERDLGLLHAQDRHDEAGRRRHAVRRSRMRAPATASPARSRRRASWAPPRCSRTS